MFNYEQLLSSVHRGSQKVLKMAWLTIKTPKASRENGKETSPPQPTRGSGERRGFGALLRLLTSKSDCWGVTLPLVKCLKKCYGSLHRVVPLKKNGTALSLSAKQHSTLVTTLQRRVNQNLKKITNLYFPVACSVFSYFYDTQRCKLELKYTGWPKKVSHCQMIKKIYETRFIRQIKV